MAYEYRRAVRTQDWHWEPACTNYPVKCFEISQVKPRTGRLCGQCADGPTMVEARREQAGPYRR